MGGVTFILSYGTVAIRSEYVLFRIVLLYQQYDDDGLSRAKTREILSHRLSRLRLIHAIINVASDLTCSVPNERFPQSVGNMRPTLSEVFLDKSLCRVVNTNLVISHFSVGPSTSTRHRRRRDSFSFARHDSEMMVSPFRRDV